MKNLIFSRKVQCTLICAMLIIFSNAPGTHAQNLQAPCLQANILILIDKSISLNEYRESLKSIQDSICKSLPIDYEQVLFSSAIFGQRFIINHFTDSKTSAQLQLENFHLSYGQIDAKTILDQELFSVEAYLLKANKYRAKNAPNILILISDGLFETPDLVSENCSLLKKHGIEIYVIGIMTKATTDEEDSGLRALATNDLHYSHSAAEPIYRIIKSITKCP